MGANGKVTTNAWVSYGGKYYYMNGSGVAVTGWNSIGGSYYYFNADGSCLVNGWAPYNGKSYYMSASQRDRVPPRSEGTRSHCLWVVLCYLPATASFTTSNAPS